MIKTNTELTAEARESLKGKWGLAIGATCVFLLIQSIVQSISLAEISASILIGIAIAGPMGLGMAIFSLTIARKQPARLQQIFTGFYNYGTALGTYLLVTIFVVLWALLLIIPGIIMSIAYSQVYYIIADNPSIKIREALKESKTMMHGHKWKYFCLALRFIGWTLLSILTLGIGLLWIIPYMNISFAKFYDDIRGTKEYA